jgi:hypothetical protein
MTFQPSPAGDVSGKEGFHYTFGSYATTILHASTASPACPPAQTQLDLQLVYGK